jgi:hypothetical protein
LEIATWINLNGSQDSSEIPPVVKQRYDKHEHLNFYNYSDIFYTRRYSVTEGKV